MKKLDHSIQLLGKDIPYISTIQDNGDVVSMPLIDFLKQGKAIKVREVVGTRTLAQNSSIHILYARIGSLLNELELSVHKVLFNTQLKKIDKGFAHAIKEYPNMEEYLLKLKEYILSDMKKTKWSGNSVKELIWRPIQKAITGKSSTTTLGKSKEITQIYEVISHKMAKDFGVDVGDFPNWESLVNQSRDYYERGR